MMSMKNTKILDGLTVFNCTWELKEEYDRLRAEQSQLKATSEEKNISSLITQIYIQNLILQVGEPTIPSEFQLHFYVKFRVSI